MITAKISGERVEIGEELIKQYDRPMPRYTSYPPAPAWGNLSPAEYEGALKNLKGPICIYIHIPFCNSKCSICGCNSIATGDTEIIARYIEACERELGLITKFIGKDVKVEQVHFGGGTPLWAGTNGISKLILALKRALEFDERTEVAIEIDPRVASVQDIDELAKQGFNRASIGIQDIDKRVCEEIGRFSDVGHIGSLVSRARKNNFKGINFDLMYGLPMQNEVGWALTLDTVIGLKPDRVAVFNFAYLPTALPNQRRLSASTMPEPEGKLKLFTMAIEHFEKAGYAYIGLDHFARRGDPLEIALKKGTLTRTFQGYTDRGGTPVVGIGNTAISEVVDTYAQSEKRLIGYMRYLDKLKLPTTKGMILSERDAARRHAIREIMCMLRLDVKGFEVKFNFDCEKEIPNFSSLLCALKQDGIIEYDGEIILLTPLGRLFSRAVANVFDSSSAKSSITYSRNV